MLRVLVIVAILFAVAVSRMGTPLLDYLHHAAQAITRSFTP